MNTVVTIVIALACIGLLFIVAFALNAKSLNDFKEGMTDPFEMDDPYNQHDQKE